MTEITDVSTLKSRPIWGHLKILKYVTVVSAIFVFLSVILRAYVTHKYMHLPFSLSKSSEELSKEHNYGVALEMLDTIGNFGVPIVLLIALYLLSALIIDRLDQLVWLNASKEDRVYIYHQRNKKKNNDKNQ